MMNTKCSSLLHKKAIVRPCTETPIHTTLTRIYFQTHCTTMWFLYTRFPILTLCATPSVYHKLINMIATRILVNSINHAIPLLFSILYFSSRSKYSPYHFTSESFLSTVFHQNNPSDFSPYKIFCTY